MFHQLQRTEEVLFILKSFYIVVCFGKVASCCLVQRYNFHNVLVSQFRSPLTVSTMAQDPESHALLVLSVTKEMQDVNTTLSL